MATTKRTPLPEIDEPTVSAFWQRYLASTGEENGVTYTDVSCFGDSVELADELIGPLDLIGSSRNQPAISTSSFVIAANGPLR